MPVPIEIVRYAQTAFKIAAKHARNSDERIRMMDAHDDLADLLTAAKRKD